MIASIHCTESAPNSIQWSFEALDCFQIFELFHPFRGFITFCLHSEFVLHAGLETWLCTWFPQHLLLISVLATTEAAVLFFMVYMPPFNVLASSFKVKYDGQIKERGMGGVC